MDPLRLAPDEFCVCLTLDDQLVDYVESSKNNFYRNLDYIQECFSFAVHQDSNFKTGLCVWTFKKSKTEFDVVRYELTE